MVQGIESRRSLLKKSLGAMIGFPKDSSATPPIANLDQALRSDPVLGPLNSAQNNASLPEVVEPSGSILNKILSGVELPDEVWTGFGGEVFPLQDGSQVQIYGHCEYVNGEPVSNYLDIHFDKVPYAVDVIPSTASIWKISDETTKIEINHRYILPAEGLIMDVSEVNEESIVKFYNDLKEFSHGIDITPEELVSALKAVLNDPNATWENTIESLVQTKKLRIFVDNWIADWMSGKAQNQVQHDPIPGIKPSGGKIPGIFSVVKSLPLVVLEAGIQTILPPAIPSLAETFFQTDDAIGESEDIIPELTQDISNTGSSTQNHLLFHLNQNLL